MNYQKLTGIIQRYKQHFAQINKEEIYKWRAVKIFQDNWDVDAGDFSGMLEESLRGAANLLASGYYYPKRMIVNNAYQSPEAIRNLFKNLFDEDLGFIDRVARFQREVKDINRINFPGKNHYQDDRAVMVYLCLRYPEQYFFYKYEMYRRFVTLVDHDVAVIRGNGGNLQSYHDMCLEIKGFAEHDQELLALHSQRINDREFAEQAFHLLTQDIIYAAVRHIDRFEQNANVLKASDRLRRRTVQIAPVKAQPRLNGIITDFETSAKERKWLGTVGEELVLEYEREITSNYPVRGEVIHASKVWGDGLGYDIRSFDEQGNFKYIEVKTTRSDWNASFYITGNELLCSNEYGECYHLYRLYQYDAATHSAKFYEHKGPLKEFCTNPVLFKAVIHEEADEL